MTHDLDVVSPWPLFGGLRVMELARKREWALAARSLAGVAAAAGSDPVTAGVEELLRAEAEGGVASTWFVISATPSLASFLAGDVTYRPEAPRAARIIHAVAARGHPIGLHGSFATMDREGTFAHQRRRLAALSAGTVEGVRQHFLRFRPGTTHRSMHAAGFEYDSSYGFPDRNGFRLGIADIVPLWDDETGRPFGLDEAPVVWMDRALSKYRAVESSEAWIDDALTLARVCREVEGLWVGIWHPNLVPALGFPGAPAAYRRLLRELAVHDPCFATLDRLVTWRRVRRSTRVRSLAPDGRVAVTAVDASPVPLETPDARPVRDVVGVSR
jgi:peptidoglycan/xylan/chitin deacetylase (PgdA/CDA1 family)